MILIDGVVFANDKQKGIQRYFHELLSRAALQVPVSVFADAPLQAPVPASCDVILRRERFPTRRVELPLWAWRRLRQRVLPTRLPPASVFHSTFYTRAPSMALPEIVTVYDMVVERMPHSFGLDCDLQVRQKAECIRAAAGIIAISQASADELVAFYPEAKSRVVVIHPGAEHLSPMRGQREGAAEKGDYCLFVGDRFRYKNFGTVLQAMCCPEWDKALRLHVVGPPFLRGEEMLIKRLGLDARVSHRGALSDDALAAEYRRCAAFVFPSLYEGFGFPILEAQSCGARVACSDIPVFREVAGDAARFFGALDPAALASAVERAANDRSAETDAKCEANLRRFSWNECTARTLDVWRAAAATR